MGVDVVWMAVLTVRAVRNHDVRRERPDLLRQRGTERRRIGVDRQRLAADLHPGVDEIEEPDLSRPERPPGAAHLNLAKLPEPRFWPDRRLAYLAALAARGAEDVEVVAFGGQLRQVAGPEELVVRVRGDGQNRRHCSPPSRVVLRLSMAAGR